MKYTLPENTKFNLILSMNKNVESILRDFKTRLSLLPELDEWEEEYDLISWVLYELDNQYSQYINQCKTKEN